MTIPRQDKMMDCMDQALKQIVAGLSAELPDSINQAEIHIELSGRQAQMTVEENGMKVEQERLMSRLERMVEEEAREANPEDPQQGVREEVAPLNDAEPDSSETENSSESGSVKESVLDKV